MFPRVVKRITLGVFIGVIFLLFWNMGYNSYAYDQIDDQYEENDTPAAAKPISLPVDSKEFKIFDSDYYAVQLNAGDHLTIEANVPENSQIKLVLLGNRTASSSQTNILASDDNPSVKERKITYTIQYTGEYIIGVVLYGSTYGDTYALVINAGSAFEVAGVPVEWFLVIVSIGIGVMVKSQKSRHF